MATTMSTWTHLPPKDDHQCPKLVCFSYAAYAKTLISHLKSINIPIHEGLSDTEFNFIESALSFTFPPDLRTILQEGVPVGHGFPNWRSSPQQLQILVDLPRLNILKRVSDHGFWCDSWCENPDNAVEAHAIVKDLLDKAPPPVPIYADCYIPSTPNMAGTPVFNISSGGDVRIVSFDLAGFFCDMEFTRTDEITSVEKKVEVAGMKSPAWAATAARRIEFWSDLAERHHVSEQWWNGVGISGGMLGSVLEDAFWRLRGGGWTEEEVREMMLMADNSDQNKGELGTGKAAMAVVEAVAVDLLRGGWSREDVVELFGKTQEDDTWLDRYRSDISEGGDDKSKDSPNRMHV